jgi:hypothetical protein
MESGPGLEATAKRFAIQLGASLTEMGPYYDRPNESVIPAVKNVAPARADVWRAVIA